VCRYRAINERPDQGLIIFPLLLLRINNEEKAINSIQASSTLRLGEIVGSQVRWREQHNVLGKQCFQYAYYKLPYSCCLLVDVLASFYLFHGTSQHSDDLG
jgi:hypothetical protein